MALTLSPHDQRGLLLDPHSGMTDLKTDLLRALHPHSFIDDPTRILRGARLAARLSLRFDAETAAQIPAALPVLDALSGERIRTELSLILRERSGLPALRLLDTWRVLAGIHPALTLPDALTDPLWTRIFDSLADDVTVRDAALWCAWLRYLAPDTAHAVAVRLMFPAPLLAAVTSAAALTQAPGFAPDDRPSRIYRALHGHPTLALQALAAGDDEGALGINARNVLKYWNGIKTVTTGNTLKALGIRQGPVYKYILDSLKEGWIDGSISSAEEEQAALSHLVKDLQA
jgi:tRNA nucleotidyltransferase (CCA-adding enzyme)